MKVFSMFSGIGGFELGLKQSNLEHEIIGYSEIDKYAISIYEEKFRGVKNYGDATTIRGDDLPDFDLLVGGFPCQSFSYAGHGKGLDDTRGTLFFDIARILTAKRPKYLVLENVKGLLSNDNGKTFQKILGVLADLGYRVEWQVLNSKDFGVPQNRERVFIVGYLGGRSGRKIFPLSIQNPKPVREISTNVVVAPFASIDRTEVRMNGRRFKNPGEPSFTLTGMDVHGIILKTIVQGESQGQRLYASSGLSTTIASQSGGWGAKTGLYQVGNETSPRIRRLTPLECERLQGFPDNWTSKLTDNQRYKTLGNAITVNVVQTIMDNIDRYKERMRW